MCLPQTLLLNGAFGVGKTTVARIIARRVPNSAISDPERIGWVLKRLPRFLPGSTRGLDDYQHSALSRRLAARQVIRCAKRHALAIVPMTFVRLDYLDALDDALRAAGIVSHRICLTARESTIYERLAARGVDRNSSEGRWVYPRALAACRAHENAAFGQRIQTDDITPETVALRVMEALET